MTTARQDILSLSDVELDRFMAAMQSFRLSDEYRIVCGLHGGGWGRLDTVNTILWNKAKEDFKHRIPQEGGRPTRDPGAAGNVSNVVDYNFCNHHGGNFGLWHRRYVAEYEWLLQQHDPFRGQDGKTPLTLPYWAWDANPQMPDVLSADKYTIRTSAVPGLGAQGTQVDNPMFNATQRPDKNAVHGRQDGKVTSRDFELNGDLPAMVTHAIQTTSFDVFNTGVGRKYLDSLEAPHDNLHGEVGGDMGDPATAAFDPIFWLHHNNVERLFVTWQTVGNGRNAPLGPRSRFAGGLYPFNRNIGTWTKEDFSVNNPVVTGAEMFHVFAAYGQPHHPPVALLRSLRAPAETNTVGGVTRGETFRTLRVDAPRALPNGRFEIHHPETGRVGHGVRFVNVSGLCPGCPDPSDPSSLWVRVSQHVTSTEGLTVHANGKVLTDVTVHLEDEEAPSQNIHRFPLLLGSKPDGVCVGKAQHLPQFHLGRGAILSVGAFGVAASTPAFQEALAAAITWWNGWLAANVKTSHVVFEQTDSFVLSDIVVSAEKITAAWMEVPVWSTTSHADGHHNVVSISISVDALSLPTTALTAIIAHDLGHVLGLAHSATHDCIMKPTFSRASGPTMTLCGDDFGRLHDALQ